MCNRILDTGQGAGRETVYLILETGQGVRRSTVYLILDPKQGVRGSTSGLGAHANATPG